MRASRNVKFIALALLIAGTLLPIHAYAPPSGASLLPRIYLPWTMGSGLSSAETGSAWSFSFNPAVPGSLLQTHVYGGYSGVLDRAAGSPEGYSSAASLGFSIPAPAGVWSGAIRFFSADNAMHTMPLGTFGLVGGGFSKRLSSRLTIGTSLWAGIGSNGTLGWGAWMDLGIIQELGSIEQPRGSTAERIGFLSDIRMGLAVRGIGREFNYASQYDPVTDSLLPGIATGFPPRCTPALGFSALLVNLPWLSINAALDLAAPSFADVEGGVGLGFSFWNALLLRTYWSTSLHDLVAGTGRSLLPSAALSGRIRLGGSNVSKGSLSAVETAAGFQPLYKSLQAVGGGVDLTFGGRDRTPPEVKAVLPAPLHGVYSFSPNADGSKDWLEIPITVRDTQGFVAGWEFRIEDPSRGDGKRVIYSTGRQLIPDRIRSLGDLFRSLARVDKDVFIPDVLRWDGRDNNGMFVPEGTYLASFYAWDNAGNKNTDLDGCLKIVVDRQPPAANTWVAGTDETYVPTDSLILSPDGDGNKDVIAFRTQGSIENAWKYEIIDRSGKAVRTVEIKEQAAPRDFVWDGTDDQGKVVSDGRYRFRLSAADESGNIGSRAVGNAPDESDWIIVDTSRPRIFLQSAVTAFSPNGDGELDVQSIDLNLESTRNLLSWELSILDQNKKQVWVRRGSGDNPPLASYSFDGRDDTGQMLPDGWYEAVARLRYRNGYTPLVASSPFLLDVVPPSATIVLEDERAIFSPDGDGSRDTLGFRLSGTREDVWKLSIVNADGRTVLEKSYIEELADRFVWDGKDASGKHVEDGRYTLVLACVDGAGNAFRTEYKPIMVDTSRPQARLALNREAFSPNDDGVADVLELRVDLDMKAGIRQWRLDLSDAAGRTIGSLGAGGTGSVPPSLLKLDGMLGAARLAEGRYRCTLELEYDNGWKTRAASHEFMLDITPPSAEVLASREVFNPKGAPEQAAVTLRQKGSSEALWTAEIRSAAGALVRSWEYRQEQPADLIWNGRTADGELLPDGTYTYRLLCVDAAGNGFASAPVSLTIDTLEKKASITASGMAFSPNGDGILDELVLQLQMVAPERLVAWELSIHSSAGVVFSRSGTNNLPASITWNGRGTGDIPVPDGQYTVTLKGSYRNGDEAIASLGPIVVDRVSPQATVKFERTIFSPNNDGRNDTLPILQESVPGDRWQAQIVNEQGAVMRTWEWADVLRSFEWDGKDEAGNVVADGRYRYVLTSRDAAGNSFRYQSPALEVETGRKTVRLTIDQRAFSPNGDGVRDRLQLRLEVAAPDQVKAYRLQIIAQEGPAAMGAVRMWQGSALPESQKIDGTAYVFEWRGETDTNLPAPDGSYAASVRVEYRNGDIAETATGTFLIDRIFPGIEVKASASIFSPDGDGRSDTVTISQNSVPGDDWKGSIRDSRGAVVRTWTWQQKAADLVWDGKDASGNVVPNGIYSYIAESEDRAGNRTVTAPLSIEVETGARPVRMNTNVKAFSPNGDGVQDELVINIDAEAVSRMARYELSIRDAQGRAVRSWTGNEDLRREYRWDGTTAEGVAVPDGRYTLALEVLYRNDALRTAGPLEVLIDRIPPQATVKFERTIFSPNNDGRNDTLPILQESVPGDRWQAQIVNEQGAVMRTWEWADVLRSFEWDGTGRDGKTVPDGTYFYELRSMDEAGNSFVLPRQRIVVDAARKAVAFRADPATFSPNDDGVKDVCFLNITAPRPETLLSFRVAVYQGPRIDPQAVPVRSWTGTTQLASQYRWDGKSDAGILLPDGVYTARLELNYANGDAFDMTAGPLVIDTVPPKIKVSAEYLLFSPNGDGNRDTLLIQQQSEPGDDWVGRIKDAAGTVVRNWTWKQQAANFTWDGKDASGRMARDGVYTYEVVSVDAAGNSTAATIKGITLDTTKPKVYVSASDTGISPNGDGIRDEVSFALTVEQRDAVESWRFSLLDQQGVERSFFGGTGSDVPTRLVWDGRDLQGQVIQGTYTGRLVVRYLKGDVVSASSAPVLVDIEPPRVEISVTPEYFSPDGDGIDDTLRFSIQVDKDAGIKEWSLEILEVAVVESSGTADQKPQRSFKTWSGKGTPPAQIVWDGRSSDNELVESATDYPFVFTSIDGLGNKTTVKGVIAVDVLVLKDGDKLKIKVPSIVFRANHADFIGLDAETVARNQRVVARIAQILNKFPDYRIRIEGHGNNIGKMLGYSQARIQQEEINELIPLSTARAEKVRAMLIENGVDSRRLSVVGLGSSEPVVKFTDVENRWKNRRVEFVLIKNQ